MDSWRQQDPTSALAWLATFRSLAAQAKLPIEKSHEQTSNESGCEESPPPRYTSFENLGLYIIEVAPKTIVREILMEDVSDAEDDL